MPERPKPDRIQTRAEFGEELTRLREWAGLTVRELATRSGIPAATVGGYLRARHLPSAGQVATFRALLAACGVPAEADVERWLAALNRVRSTSDGRLAQTPSPYPGLASFRTEDAATFFGRDRAIAAVVDALRRMATSPSGPLLTLVGPSGSGKSSLLRAGLVPAITAGALGNGPADCAVITLGLDPRAAVNDALLGEPRLLIIDQFEELFTQCPEATDRQWVLEKITGLDPARTMTVAGMRADFYSAAAREPLLVTALQDAQIVLAPMTRDELLAAITGPARQVGASIEDALVDLLLNELAPRAERDYAHAPGALPLLSHALLATWQHARRKELTVADYLAVGGLEGAVQQSAEDAYLALAPAEQRAAHRLFLRLATAEGPVATRRRLEGAELHALTAPDTADAAATNAVLDRFIEGRLLTAGADSVEVSHESLLWAWPRLRDWLDEDRDGLRLQRQLTEASVVWEAAARDSSAVLRGGRLEAALEWASEPERFDSLNTSEREFLEASEAARDAERLAARRHTRRLQRLLAVICVLALGCAGLAVVALVSRAHADTQRKRAEILRNQALSRQVAIEATRAETTDPALAAELALAAYRISPTTDARSVLIDNSTLPAVTRVLGADGPTALAVTADSTLLAVSDAASGAVRLYRPVTGGEPTLISTVPGDATDQLFALAFSPDGRLLATGGASGQVQLWNLADPTRPRKWDARLALFGASVQSLTFSPDGHTLTAVGGKPQERSWDVIDPAQPRPLAVLAGTGDPTLVAQAGAYSPDGRTLALGGAGSVRLWATDSRTSTPIILSAGSATVTGLAFSPNGSLLAASSKDGAVYVFDLSDPHRPRSVSGTPLTGFTTWVNALRFSPDGRYLAAGSSDTTLRIWKTSDWSQVQQLDQPAPITGLAITPDGSSVITTAADGSLRIARLELEQPHAAGSVFSVGFTASGTELEAGSASASGTVSTWTLADPGDGGPPRTTISTAGITATPGFGDFSGTSAISGDGTLVAAGSSTGHVQMWKLSPPSSPHSLGPLLAPTTSLIEAVAISPNNHLLAVGADDGNVYLWDITDPTHPRPLPTLAEAGNEILNLAFSADGHLLTAASADQTVRLWDVGDSSSARQLAVLRGFSAPAFSVAISPDGRLLAAGGGDDTVRLWDISDPAHPRSLGSPLTGPTNYVLGLSFTPDSTMLAAGSPDKTVWLWNVREPTKPVLTATLRAAGAAVNAVAFSPDGHTLAEGEGGGGITFWDTNIGALRQELCRTTGTPLTRAEWRQYIPGAGYDPPCR